MKEKTIFSDTGLTAGKNAAPFSIVKSIMKSIEDSIKSGNNVELVPFHKWQKERGLSITVNSSEFRPTAH